MNNNNDNGSGPWGTGGGDHNPWGRKPQNNQTPPDMDEILKHDLWWDSATCLRYGLVDEVI